MLENSINSIWAFIQKPKCISEETLCKPFGSNAGLWAAARRAGAAGRVPAEPSFPRRYGEAGKPRTQPSARSCFLLWVLFLFLKRSADAKARFDLKYNEISGCFPAVVTAHPCPQ